MDKLSKAMQEHAKISESTTFFKESLEIFTERGGTDCIEKIQKFLNDDIIAHFEFEEKKLFLPVLMTGTLKEKHLIRELQIEHIQMLDKIDQLKASILFYNSSAGKEIRLKKIMASVIGIYGAIYEEFLKHAHKEDAELFPIFKKT